MAAGEKVKIKMTPHQMGKLRPLFGEAHEAADKGEKGMVLFQADANGDLTGVFFPKEFAEQLSDVAREYKASLEMKEVRQKTERRRRG